MTTFVTLHMGWFDSRMPVLLSIYLTDATQKRKSKQKNSRESCDADTISSMKNLAAEAGLTYVPDETSPSLLFLSCVRRIAEAQVVAVRNKLTAIVTRHLKKQWRVSSSGCNHFVNSLLNSA